MMYSLVYIILSTRYSQSTVFECGMEINKIKTTHIIVIVVSTINLFRIVIQGKYVNH